MQELFIKSTSLSPALFVEQWSHIITLFAIMSLRNRLHLNNTASTRILLCFNNALIWMWRLSAQYVDAFVSRIAVRFNSAFIKTCSLFPQYGPAFRSRLWFNNAFISTYSLPP